MHVHPVTPSGASIAWLDVGPSVGPVTVYLGGLGSATTVALAPVVAHPRLAGGRHLLVDLIGSGWSDPDDGWGSTIEGHADAVAAVLDHLGLASVPVVGHSLGGSVAIALSSRRPDLVGRLVVAEPNLDAGVGSFSVRVAAVDEEEFVADTHDRLVGELLAAAAEGDTNAAGFARTLRRWSSRGLHRTAVSLLAERPVSFRDRLGAFAGPRHYVSGGRSHEDLDPLRATGTTVHVVPGAGHVLMEDDLDGFVAALVAARRGVGEM